MTHINSTFSDDLSSSDKVKSYRQARIIIRVTDDEKQKIETNAAGNVSNFIRQAALKDKRRIPKITLQDPNLIKALNYINGQWNQLNRAVNINIKAGAELDLAQINIQLALIREDINKLVTINVT